MKWADFDTNKNAFPETVKIITDWLSFVSERWDRINDKNKFIEQNLQPLFEGKFREPEIKNGKIEWPSPALGTLLRNLGFIDDNYNVSKLVFLISQQYITLQEYSLINLSKQRGWIDKSPKVNFLVLLCLFLKQNNYCDISVETLETLSKVKGYSLELDENINDKNRNDILYNLIKNIGLFEEDISKKNKCLKLKENAKSIVDFIVANKDKIAVHPSIDKNERYVYYGDLVNGIFQLLDCDLPLAWSEYYPNLLNKDSFCSKAARLKHSNYIGSLNPKILFGPPGTGKTYKMQTEYFSKFGENGIITTFHQSYSYEDFVEGLKPVLANNQNQKENSSKDIEYRIERGVFYSACEKAAILAGYTDLKACIDDSKGNRAQTFNKAKENKNTFLLCIDEINRGNVAAIFGDLISLIESSKRLGAENEIEVTLPYSKEKFGVPANLLIVGTMNTADRSIQLLDSALRRRFKFEELLPNYDVIKNDSAKIVLKNINARVRCLLNKDNQIGHSYLMFAKSYCDILSALYNKIIPLLEEYFYNDIDKVRFVLNDSTDACFYVEDTESKEAYKLFQNEEIDDEDRDFYELNPAIAIAIEKGNEEECKKYLANLIK